MDGSVRASRMTSQPAPREWNADAYHRLSAPQFEWGMRVLDRAAPREGERVLDAGCGSARLTLELARRMGSGYVVGVDASANMVDAAARTLQEGTRHISTTWSIVRADLTALPFTPELDLVFSTASFHWVRDHARLFASIGSVLAPRGRLEAQCGGGANLARTLSRARRIVAEAPFERYFTSWREPWYFATAEGTGARLRKAGFQYARCWLEPMPTQLPDAGTYREFLETVVLRLFLARLPGSELCNELLDRMVDVSERDDQPFMLDYWRLNISASRS